MFHDDTSHPSAVTEVNLNSVSYSKCIDETFVHRSMNSQAGLLSILSGKCLHRLIAKPAPNPVDACHVAPSKQTYVDEKGVKIVYVAALFKESG